MEKTEPGKRIKSEHVVIISLAAFGVLLIVLLLLNIFGGNDSQRVRQRTSSDLISTEEIATLSVSEFVYNGIAQQLTADGKPEYNVLYKSTVKVSIDADKLDYSVDEEKKVVTFVFPELTIERPVVEIESLSIIPNRSDLHMDDVLDLCRSDALSEAQKSDKLISSARDNIKSIMEAWYSPALEGYSFEYRFGSSEGGEAK